MATPRSHPNEGTLPLDPLAGMLGYQLRRASQVLMARLGARLEEHGLSVVEASVLLVIEENPGITQSEAGRVLDIHRANVAPIAAKLAAMELTQIQLRGRRGLLRVTGRGRRVARAVRAEMEAHESALAAGLSQSDRERLLEWLGDVWAPQGEDASLAAR